MRQVILSLVVVALLAGIVSAELNSIHRVFGDKPECGKQAQGAKCGSKKPCCSKYGFCGENSWACLEKNGCQSGCKAERNLISPGKPKAVVPSNAGQKVIVKTISTAVPVCENCNKKAEEQKVAEAQKTSEETTESVTESRPGEEEKVPKCPGSHPDCSKAAMVLSEAQKQAAKIIADAQAKANGESPEQAAADAKRPMVKLQVKIGGRGAGAAPAHNTMHIGYQTGGGLTGDVLNPAGY
eukprot:CAMPEP_0183338668 /NCGR_PEP_ID=MMETSP0164_2-20130417/5882_1 /TAXON_ID=221442 /ORGANISM="Coccolithus pelagicus ssp braarudi, Strain PLY182g" /LENGTH=239 /DNA_ID=CAMNT_0025508553 /DNA_START=17 /DNA_END=736 /DNA_ORIENTATION=-